MDFQNPEDFPPFAYEHYSEEFAYWHGLSETFALSSATVFFVGMATMLVASIVFLESPRRDIAIVSLPALFLVVVLSLAGPDESLLWPISLVGLIFLTLLSLVRWPVNVVWVNGPLLYGSGLSGLLFIAAIWAQPDLTSY